MSSGFDSMDTLLMAMGRAATTGGRLRHNSAIARALSVIRNNYEVREAFVGLTRHTGRRFYEKYRPDGTRTGYMDEGFGSVYLLVPRADEKTPDKLRETARALIRALDGVAVVTTQAKNIADKACALKAALDEDC